MGDKQIVITLDADQMKAFNEATNFSIDKLVFEISTKDNSLSFKGVLSEAIKTDKIKYLENVKILMPCQDHDGNE